MIGRHHVTNAVRDALHLGDRVVGAVTPADDLGLGLRRVGAVFGEDRDHAPRRIAVQRRERSAQHFDTLRRGNAEASRLPLSVGHGGRDAVLIEPDAANAEVGARAKATHRHLQILRVVPPIGDDNTGDPRE